MAKRKGLSKRIRFEVFKRDGFTCQYCGRTPPVVLLQVDHITAVANGGDDDPINLITSCADCNAGKSNIPLSSIPKPLAEEIRHRKEMSEQVEAYNAMLMEIRDIRDSYVADLASHWYDQIFPTEAGKWTFGQQRLASIRRFMTSLPAAKIYEAMDIALSKYPVYDTNDDRTWRYFCGICWRMIKDD